MVRELAAASLIFLSAAVASAATRVITGHHECEQVRVRGAEIYDARGSSVRVEQGTCLNTGYRVMNSPDPALWLGGSVLGTNDHSGLSWDVVHDRGNGAGLLVQNSSRMTVRGVFIDRPWDGIRPAAGVSHLTVVDSWLRDVGDDAIEADHRRDLDTLTIRNSLLQDVHTAISSRRGGRSASPTPAVTWRILDSLISLGLHKDTRAKRKYPWAPGELGSGQLFKTEGLGRNTEILIRNTIVMMRQAPKSARRTLRIIPDEAELDPASGGNVLVWLGGDRVDGLDMVTVDGVRVPEAFGLHELTNVFSVTDDPQVWDAARARWLAAVWRGAAGAGAK